MTGIDEGSRDGHALGNVGMEEGVALGGKVGESEGENAALVGASVGLKVGSPDSTAIRFFGNASWVEYD